MWHSGQALAKAKSRSITAMIRRLDSSSSSEHDLTLTQWIAHIDKDPEARPIWRRFSEPVGLHGRSRTAGDNADGPSSATWT
jgi:hypothetical protein